MVHIPFTTAVIWSDWIDATTSTASTTDIYTNWLSQSTATSTSSTIFSYWLEHSTTLNTATIPTAREHIAREMQRAREDRFVQKQQARKKAKILLLENLNEIQKNEFTKDGFFFVKSPSGRVYRLQEGRSINIDLMKGNSRIEVEKRLCAHPAIDCPNEDTMLAQKVFLEHMERDFLNVAKEYAPVRH